MCIFQVSSLDGIHSRSGNFAYCIDAFFACTLTARINALLLLLQQICVSTLEKRITYISHKLEKLSSYNWMKGYGQEPTEEVHMCVLIKCFQGLYGGWSLTTDFWDGSAFCYKIVPDCFLCNG